MPSYNRWDVEGSKGGRAQGYLQTLAGQQLSVDLKVNRWVWRGFLEFRQMYRL